MNLVRVLGIAAIAGGVLRIVDSFTTGVLSPQILALLYFNTDVLLLLGMAGIYWSRRAMLGIAGIAGVVLFTLGIVWIRIAAFAMSGANGYPLGAAIALLGLGVLSADELLRGRDEKAAAIFWLAALLFAVVGALGLMAPLMTIAAGVAFGAGFVMAGRKLLAGTRPAIIPAR
jgi:hypothetical protein